jgi:hypothetical protein
MSDLTFNQMKFIFENAPTPNHARAIALNMISKIIQPLRNVEGPLSGIDDVLMALDESGRWPDENTPADPRTMQPIEPDLVYHMVAYGSLEDGMTFFGPFEEAQACAYAEHISGTGFDSQVIPLTEARIMNRMHGFFPMGPRGYVVDNGHFQMANSESKEATIPVTVVVQDEVERGDLRNTLTDLEAARREAAQPKGHDPAIVAIHIADGFYMAPEEVQDELVLRYVSEADRERIWNRSSWLSITEEERQMWRNNYFKVRVIKDDVRPTYFSIGLSSDESDKYGGMIGASVMIASAARRVVAAWDAVHDRYEPQYIGVFDYEVSEEIGKRLREVGQFDADHAVKLFVEFFHEIDPVELTALVRKHLN